jgi:hypothetical protein
MALEKRVVEKAQAAGLQVENSLRRRGSIQKAREYIGKLEQTVGNRTREEGSRESEGSGAILNQAADEWDVEGLSQ